MTKKIEVFASEALPGELEDFPDIKRGWGTTKESTGGIPPMKWFNAIQKRTDEAINNIANNTLGGYSFKDGATLESGNDFIYDDVTKSWYSWIGDTPKFIDANSVASEVIDSDGGVWSESNINGKWVDLSSGTDLTKSDGSSKLGTPNGSIGNILNRWLDVTKNGVSTTNTPKQNTDALLNIQKTYNGNIYFPSGTYQFDVFKTNRLNYILGEGKEKTIIELHGVASPVMVQPGNQWIDGFHFKSVAGDKQWSRIGFVDGTKIKNCKVSDFYHNPERPDAWGCYVKNAKGCRISNVEFSNNTQSDIAILEGAVDLIVESCYHTDGKLVVNFEPNISSPEQNGIIINNTHIHLLSLLVNDSRESSNNVAVINACKIKNLEYDGLGVTFNQCEIENYVNTTDSRNRVFGGVFTGVKTNGIELVRDPLLLSVGAKSSSAYWRVNFSTVENKYQYNRLPTGELVVSPTVAGATSLISRDIPCLYGDAYVISISRRYLKDSSRPDITSAIFVDSELNPITEYYLNSGGYHDNKQDMYQCILSTPSNAKYLRIKISGSDTGSVVNEVAYSFVSVKKIERKGIFDNSSLSFDRFYSSHSNPVRLGVTYSEFVKTNYYYAPIPEGCKVEFNYESGQPYIAEIVRMATDNTGKIGELRVLLNYQ